MVKVVIIRASAATTKNAISAAFVELVLFLALELMARVRRYVINKAPRICAMALKSASIFVSFHFGLTLGMRGAGHRSRD